MSKSTTVDVDGDVISTTVGTNGITVQFSRKLGRENYGNEEVGIFLQIDADPEADAATLEAQVKGGLAFAKTVVYTQLGIDSTVDDGGIVRDVPQPEKQKASGGGKGKPPAKAAAASGAAPDKDALWANLAEAYGDVGSDGRIKGFYDNRPKKEAGEYSSKSPDFKHIDSGAGLWLDKAPAFVKLALGI